MPDIYQENIKVLFRNTKVDSLMQGTLGMLAFSVTKPDVCTLAHHCILKFLTLFRDSSCEDAVTT